ncbi:MAG: helix-turn-helix transcriptional regulator [Saprospiraceae bacterium]
MKPLYILNKISPREREVLYLLAYEYTTDMIANKLYISYHTVVSHRKNLLAKLDVKNVAGLVRRGFELGYLSSVITGKNL